MLTAVFADGAYDPGSVEIDGPVTVLIEEGRISSVGKRDVVQVPAAAERIDADGLIVLPGLIDCHVHLSLPGDRLMFQEELMKPPSLKLLQSVAACRATLEAGFTTVRDAGGTPHGVRLAVERELFPGPRMVLAVQALSQTGGHTDQTLPCGLELILMPWPDVPPSVVDGVEPMRKRVRELIAVGADWIKLCTSGGILSSLDQPHHASFTMDEIRAAVDEAAVQGRLVMVHAHANAGIKNALHAGVATIEHGAWLDDEAIDLFLAHDRVLVPTLAAFSWIIRHAEGGRVSPEAGERARAVASEHRSSMRRAIEAGVRIAFGTDTGVGPHGSMGEEFVLLHGLGLDAASCIRTATTTAADVLGLSGSVGTLAENAFGDLIGVAGDPLSDLRVLSEPKNIQLVVKNGKVVKDRGAWPASSRDQGRIPKGSRKGSRTAVGH